jgi:hypothetical protein
MKRLFVSLAASACLVALLGGAPARAQNFVTFVAESGNDANNCESIAEACRQLIGENGAIAKTPSGGVIHVLPGEYVAFPIQDKSLDIIADGGQASIVNNVAGPIPNITGNAGIVIAVGAGDVVRVRGFIVNTHHGIAIGGAGGIVHLENNTLIAGLSDRYGIIYSPSSASELYVRDTTIARENGITGGGGILIRPLGSGSAKVVLDNVQVDDTSPGILVDGRATNGVSTVTVRDSVVAGSTTYGLLAIDSGGGASNVMIEGSSFANNVTNGVWVSGTNTTVRIRDSTVSGNGRGLAGAATSNLISQGGNTVAGNTVDGLFSSSQPLK